MQAPTGRRNSILNRWVNMYIIAKIFEHYCQLKNINEHYYHSKLSSNCIV